MISESPAEWKSRRSAYIPIEEIEPGDEGLYFIAKVC